QPPATKSTPASGKPANGGATASPTGLSLLPTGPSGGGPGGAINPFGFVSEDPIDEVPPPLSPGDYFNVNTDEINEGGVPTDGGDIFNVETGPIGDGPPPHGAIPFDPTYLPPRVGSYFIPS